MTCRPLLAAACLAAPFLPAAANAQQQAAAPTLQQAIGSPDDFRLSGSVRLRFETLDGQPRAGFRADEDQLALRSTLFAEYDPGTLRIGAELYDSRAWLTQPGTTLGTGEVNTFELVQAYVAADFDAPFGPGSKLGVQAGRFTLNLGSRRLVAADDYRNTTNGYTGLRADLKTAGGVTATAIYVLPQVRLPDDLPSLLSQDSHWDRESFDLQLWGGLVARPATLAGGTLELGYFGLHERDAPGRPNRNRDLDSFSARVIRDPKPGKLDFEAEGVWQTGSIRASAAANAALLDVQAWFVHAEAGYTFPGKAKLHLSLEYDRASGDAPGGTYTRFDTLFGMRRADLAPAGLYNAVGRANISALGLRAEVAPSPRWDLFAAYRPLWPANRRDSFSTSGVRDASGAAGNFAGHQVEGRLRRWLVPGLLRAEVNAVYLAKGRFYAAAPNSPGAADTLYLATGLTATF